MVALRQGIFSKADGFVAEDFEPLSVGTIAQLPTVTGTIGCSLDVGVFHPRL